MDKSRKIISIGDGANVSAPITAAESISNSFNTLANSKIGGELQELLELLLVAISELNVNDEKIIAHKVEMAQDADYLVKEVTKEQPRRNIVKQAIDSIIASAKDIGTIALPILIIIEKIQAIFG